MGMISYALFETAIGWAGVAWGEAGLVAVHLPEREAETARKGFLRRFPDAAETEPTPEVRAAMDAIGEQLAGKPTDLSGILLDLSRTPQFHIRVYEIARAIPPGETLTYGEVAERLGDKRLARDVGQALGHNPWPIVVPCHRVTAAGGRLGGFSAPGGAATKLRLLAIEGAKAAAQGDLFG
jgi:methylated-DNA-[protein]-cysteine S-methyltransferase